MSEENKGFNWEIPRKPEQPETKQLDLNFLDIMAILAGLQLLKKKHLDDLSLVRAFVINQEEKERIEKVINEGLEKINQITNTFQNKINKI